MATEYEVGERGQLQQFDVNMTGHTVTDGPECSTVHGLLIMFLYVDLRSYFVKTFSCYSII